VQPTTSFDLLERAKNGSRQAASDLFERYRRRLTLLVRYKVAPEWRARLDIDDLVQETLLRAYRDLPGFTYRGPSSFFHWLSSIAGHVIADAIRYHGRVRREGRPTHFRSPSNPNGPEPADSVTPSRVFAQEERLQRLIRLLDALPENYREALVLAKFEGLTTAEMAARLAISREAVALLVFRAAQRLRELIRRDELQ